MSDVGPVSTEGTLAEEENLSRFALPGSGRENRRVLRAAARSSQGQA